MNSLLRSDGYETRKIFEMFMEAAPRTGIDSKRNAENRIIKTTLPFTQRRNVFFLIFFHFFEGLSFVSNVEDAARSRRKTRSKY